MEAGLSTLRPKVVESPVDKVSIADSVRQAFEETSANYASLVQQAEAISEIALEIAARIARGGCVMFCGNGGSAADSEHLAAELQGRFLRDRAPLAAMALSANVATLTAIGNDYGFDEVFERQVRGLAKPGDVLVAISTSGNSKNIVRALNAAKLMSVYTVGLTGESGGVMSNYCDAVIRVPSARTPRIQEMHIGVGHMICQIIEDALF
jgi:D-sedoheptulose 7-phosphate isomerase